MNDVSGPTVVAAFEFQQQNTDMVRLLEFTLRSLDESRMSSVASGTSDYQLLFIISDGRISDRDRVRQLTRDALSKQQLIAFILVDSAAEEQGQNSSQSVSMRKQSVMQMQKVEYVSDDAGLSSGKPRMQITPFMDDFPFSFYAVISNVSSLPQVLGDALRQWLELMASRH